MALFALVVIGCGADDGPEAGQAGSSAVGAVVGALAEWRWGGFFGMLACHANSIGYSQSQDSYALSSLSEVVFVLQRGSGDATVRERLSQVVSGGNSTWGGYQHGVHLLEVRAGGGKAFGYAAWRRSVYGEPDDTVMD